VVNGIATKSGQGSINNSKLSNFCPHQCNYGFIL
jgi:hypothetical protein